MWTSACKSFGWPLQRVWPITLIMRTISSIASFYSASAIQKSNVHQTFKRACPNNISLKYLIYLVIWENLQSRLLRQTIGTGPGHSLGRNFRLQPGKYFIFQCFTSDFILSFTYALYTWEINRLKPQFITIQYWDLREDIWDFSVKVTQATRNKRLAQN